MKNKLFGANVIRFPTLQKNSEVNIENPSQTVAEFKNVYYVFPSFFAAGILKMALGITHHQIPLFML